MLRFGVYGLRTHAAKVVHHHVRRHLVCQAFIFELAERSVVKRGGEIGDGDLISILLGGVEILWLHGERPFVRRAAVVWHAKVRMAKWCGSLFRITAGVGPTSDLAECPSGALARFCN